MREVKEAEALLNKSKVVAIADLQKVRTAQLQEIQKKLIDIAYLRVFKNNVMKRALKSVKKPNIEDLYDHLTGSNIFLFTDLNPYALKIFLDKSKVITTAKAGEVASFDVKVPAGNTGLPPGPIISQLNTVGLPTRIEAGSVWINKDTLVAREGDVIDMRLAAALSKLGINSVKVGLSLKAAYVDGMVLGTEDLALDLDEVKSDFEEASRIAFILSVEVAYPTAENINSLLRRAFQDAYSLSINAAIVTVETFPDLIRKAYTQAAALNNILEDRHGYSSGAQKD